MQEEILDWNEMKNADDNENDYDNNYVKCLFSRRSLI